MHSTAQTCRLVVNADDFGFTRDVNAGIAAAHRDGILTATTIMADGAAFDDAARLAKEHPGLDIGCHLVLVQGPGLPRTITELIWALAKRSLAIYPLLERQVRKILRAGLEPTHLDTHKHTHLAPPVLDAVLQIAREFGIGWVRRPVDFPLPGLEAPRAKRLVHAGVQALGARFDARFRRAGVRATDYFTGFQLTGEMGTAGLAATIRGLPDGITELMCHPGYCGEELRSAQTRLKQSRATELEALLSPEARAALKERNAHLCTYKDL